MNAWHKGEAADELAFPKPKRRLRLGIAGGGQGAFIGPVHANGARLSGRWEVVAGALSSRPEIARQSGRDWFLAEDRIYTDYRVMAAAEAARADGIDAVAITTPNASHHPIARAFMEHGIDVISDKPLTVTLEEALDLVRLQRETGLVFGVTYSFSGHAMVRQARQMIAQGAIGAVRQVHVEYFQEWAMDVADAWRLDSAKGGPTFTTGDIGTHAHHLACFVTGLEMTALRADFLVTGSPKPKEDTAFMHVRFAGDVAGTLMVSQAAAGTQCGLRLRVFGETGGLEWDQENPEYLRFNQVGMPAQIISRGLGGGMGVEASRFVRMPRGHPEALSDAWANLYTEFAIAIEARRDGRTLPEALLRYPTVLDGAKGMKFIEAAAHSAAHGGSWTDCLLEYSAIR
ncbi:putative oxidoreductase y4hM [Acidocella aquatica]|uniref:Oxidoreductase y4hM n=1 Tax=Acidocella aquatica TaxID=1922313 RepID=A0ABQ6A375_9PROT|nr:Gfo/Idh/MocA family oxidoreductase [Acidocella aquatica]GLR66634.1 putative oxidoreductase y4hM [Acidocella aquatica]